MSYDLNFWRYKARATRDHQQVYNKLCDGLSVDGLEILPIDDLVRRVHEVFNDWSKLDDVTYDHADRGGFQIYSSPQYFRVDCYGMQGEDMNKFIDIANEFGCALYDPQVGKRFDQDES